MMAREDAHTTLLNGETRVHLCVGDPITQVKSPAGLTSAFAARGVNAVCIPAHVPAADFPAFMAVAKRMLNVDGFVITVPHKFTAFAHCDELSDRARFLSAVNVIRRDHERWLGEMTDGIALLAALYARGFKPKREDALVVGAGGAGSAVALALVQAGIGELAIADLDAERRQDLVTRLKELGANVRASGADPSGCRLVVNATPAGMARDDPLPIDPARIDHRAVVADLITRPVVTPLLHAARKRGAVIVTGADMFATQQNILADFLLGAPLRA
jgi:shikimate dehydrogenase